MKKKPTILIVEDHLILRKTLLTALESFGYLVIEAVDGLEALVLLEDTSVDLILCDLNMPRLDGNGLLRKVRARPDWQHIPFLMLSAYDNDPDLEEAKRLGANDYLLKPIDMKTLKEYVAQQFAS